MTGNRRSLRSGRGVAALLAAMLLAALAGCGITTGKAASPPVSTPTASASPTTPPALYPVEPNAYPVYVHHQWGITKITSEPKRIVVLGFREQEDMVALGVYPIAVRNFFGSAHPWAASPWLTPTAQQQKYDGIVADVRDPKNGHTVPGSDGPIMASGFPQASNTPPFKEVYNLDEIRALHPDLITAMFSGVTQQDFQQLSQIAPTITGVSDDRRDYYSAWQEEMTAVGKALGRPAAAGRIVSQTEDLFRSTLLAHPELRGAKVAVAAPGPTGQFRLINPFAPLARFFSSLGASPPADVEAITNQRGKLSKTFYDIDLTTGDLSLLNGANVVVWLVGPDGQADMDKLKQTSGYQNISAVAKGHSIELGPDEAEALFYASPNSIPWLLNKIEPVLLPMLAGRSGG